MKSDITREKFFVELNSAIPDADQRERLIQSARTLIPGKADLDKLSALKSKQVYMALVAYR